MAFLVELVYGLVLQQGGKFLYKLFVSYYSLGFPLVLIRVALEHPIEIRVLLEREVRVVIRMKELLKKGFIIHRVVFWGELKHIVLFADLLEILQPFFPFFKRTLPKPYLVLLHLFLVVNQCQVDECPFINRTLFIPHPLLEVFFN